MAKPTAYSQAMATLICDRIAQGESLKTICKSDNVVTRGTVWVWMKTNPDFAAQMSVAREFQAHSFYDEILDTARNATDAKLDRLLVDTLKWAACKMLPKVYGDRIQHTGADDKPLFPQVTVLFGPDSKLPED